MSSITAKDGTQIYYKDWGEGQPIMFSNGWPLNSDSWESQMFFMASNGFRCIAHDRRGHGRSSQPWDGNDMNTFADDLETLMEKLTLNNVVLVVFSMGGGEVARYVGRHGTKRVAKIVLVGAVPPLMVKTPSNPGGLPLDVFNGLRKGLVDNRSQLFRDLASGPFHGFNRAGAKVSQGMIDWFWMQGMNAWQKNTHDCIEAFSQIDFTQDLKKFVPTLFIDGDDDQIVPIEASARAAHKPVKGSKLIIYPGAPHGLTDTHKNKFNTDLPAFLREGRVHGSDMIQIRKSSERRQSEHGWLDSYDTFKMKRKYDSDRLQERIFICSISINCEKSAKNRVQLHFHLCRGAFLSNSLSRSYVASRCYICGPSSVMPKKRRAFCFKQAKSTVNRTSSRMR